VSCITGGRKTNLRDKLKALRAKKREIEAEMKKRSGGRMSIVGGSLKMIEQLDVEGGGVEGDGGGRQGCQGCASDWRRRDQGGGGGERRAENARLEREKKTEKELREAAETKREATERDLKATREELEALKKNI